jgi:hypothetical protein
MSGKRLKLRMMSLGDSVIDGAAASETFGSGAQRQIEYDELKGKLAGPAFNEQDDGA